MEKRNEDGNFVYVLFLIAEVCRMCWTIMKQILRKCLPLILK